MTRRTSLAIVLAFATVANAQSMDVDRMRGGGSWKTDGEVKRTTQQWSLDLRRSDDGTVSGLITIKDSPLFSVGKVHGKLDDRVISGTITDEEGKEVAQFNGVLSRSGFRGKYVDRTGESGDWEWEGTLPE